MQLSFPVKNNYTILALGAESSGNFSVYKNGKIFFSKDFGDLLNEEKWLVYKKTVLSYLKIHNMQPDIILIDLHPLFNTTHWGKELAQKYNARLIQIQHHLAHIFSAVGDKIIHNVSYTVPNTFYGIACDGTGYGLDGHIWGGEIFKITKNKFKHQHIGHLENQTLIGNDLAIREPARMLISILNKFLNKEKVYSFVKKYYSKNDFELLYNQLQQNFNCEYSSSVGRILDAVSLLLGFCGNERKYKHEPIDLLEKNSIKSYTDIRPKITISKDNYVLDTTFLFKYLIKNINQNKKRLAATAQLYIARGLYEIINKYHSNFVLKSKQTSKQVKSNNIFFAGGMANNKIISEYLTSQNVYISQNIPRGDAGLSFGQIVYYLLLK